MNTPPDLAIYKRCCACKQFKPVEAFHRRKGGDGFQYACKVCINTRDSSGRYAGQSVEQPMFVECLCCNRAALCSLDNPYWLNQYDDDMTDSRALCSAHCYNRMVGSLVRVKRLIALNKD